MRPALTNVIAMSMYRVMILFSMIVIGQGVECRCIYVRKSISFDKRSDLVPENLEAVCIEVPVTKPNSRPFIVSSFYKPPSAPVEIFNSIERMIGQIDNEDKETYILGNLNCNLLDQKSLDNDVTLNICCESWRYISSYAIN